MNGLTIILPVMLPFAAAVLCLARVRSLGWQKFWGVAGSAAALVSSVILLFQVDAAGMLVVNLGDWPAPFGIALVADRLSAIMVAVSALMGFLICVYSLSSIDEDRMRRYYFPLFLFLLFGVNGALLTGDLFNLYVWFEVMLIASFVLTALGNTRQQLEGALKYVFINLFASSLFLAGAGVVYARLGTLNMADIAQKLSELPDPMLMNSMGVLLLLAFALKAGLFPLFFWLPASYHTPPAAVSALFAALLTKVGVYALIRTYTLILSPVFESLQVLLMFIAALTMVTGVLGAAAQFEMRRILSFHIISQIGYMIMGLALMTPLALAGAILYMIHNIVVKTNLFLICGVVDETKGTGELKRIGGLYQSYPYLAVLFFICAFSLAGIPPFSGFWAKFSVVKAGLDAGAWYLVATALVVGIMTLFSMTKIWGEAFWKPQPEDEEVAAHERKPRGSLRLMTVPCLVLTMATVAIGLCGEPLFGLFERAAEQLLNPSEYIAGVLPPKEVDLP